MDTRIKGPGRIAVDRVTVETETVSTVLPYETLKRTTSDLAVGEVRVAQEGIAGEGREVYKITKVNGEETERELLSQDILVEPQTLILENGTSGKLESRGEVIRYKKVLDVKATAYTSSSGAYTASGTVARVGAIAVDPTVIPLGSRVYITSDDGTSWIYGYAVCEDTGGKIKGNRIDLFFNTESECINFGVKQAKVYIL